MRIIGAFLCFFLFVLTSGTVSYIYLMWTNYWIRVQSMETRYSAKQVQRLSDNHPKRSVLHRRQKFDTAEDIAADVDKVAVRPQRPRFGRNYALEDITKKDISLAELPQDKLLAHLRVYKDQLYSQLRNTVMDTGKQVEAGSFPNTYNVSYKGSLGEQLGSNKSPHEILCDAQKKINLLTLKRDNTVFQNLNLNRFFPKKSLLQDRHFNTCAVVSSAGSLKGSGLGSFIDTHDIVLRFNNAPTDNFEKDVGKKTSIRIVNSQVVAKPQFKFLESKFYSKSAVLVWDPSAYSASLEEWYNKPDWPFFEQFFNKRLMQPEDALYLLHPGSLWSIWNWLQSITAWPLLPTPPSSGFLGIMLLLNHCSTIHVFEYIPSMRLTKRCHYYDSSDNLGCTLGDWHPLSAEKLAALSLHTGGEVQMLRDGFITVPGFTHCSSQ